MCLVLCVFVFVHIGKTKPSKMSDTENSDNFADEIVESGVVRKTVKRSYIIQEVSINKEYFIVYMF